MALKWFCKEPSSSSLGLFQWGSCCQPSWGRSSERYGSPWVGRLSQWGSPCQRWDGCWSMWIPETFASLSKNSWWGIQQWKIPKRLWWSRYISLYESKGSNVNSHIKQEKGSPLRWRCRWVHVWLRIQEIPSRLSYLISTSTSNLVGWCSEVNWESN